MKCFFPQQFGTNPVPLEIIKKGKNHSGISIFRHELLLIIFQVFRRILTKHQPEISWSEYLHSFRPHLLDIFPWTCFIIKNMTLCSLRINHDRHESSVTGTIKRKCIHSIGSTAKHALSRSVLWLCLIRYFINITLPTDKRLNILNAPSTGSRYHFRQFYDEMSLHFSEHIFIIKFFQIISKPWIIHGKEPEKCGLSGSLTTHQYQHILKLRPWAKHSWNSPQQKNFHCFVGIDIPIRSKKVIQHIFDTLFFVPH